MRARRGTATVELAVLLPVGVLLLTAGQWISELLAVRLKAREAARHLAWDPDSGVRAIRRTEGSYADFDSARQTPAPQALFARGAPVQARREGLRLGWAAPSTPLEPDAAGRAAVVAARARAAPLTVSEALGFSAPQLVRAVVSTSVSLPRLGVHLFGPEGSPSARTLPLEELVAVVTDDWASGDGADSRVTGGRTGTASDGTRTELWRRVDRMKFLGDPSALAPERSLASGLGAVLPFVAPDLDGTFVVDHGVREGEGRRCAGVPGFPREGLSGLRDFAGAVEPGAPRCFGTQPLRDTQKYAASLPLQARAERGPYAMGCFTAEADDPSRAADADLTDANVQKESCGGRP